MSHPANEAFREAQLDWIEKYYPGYALIQGRKGEWYASKDGVSFQLPARLQEDYQPDSND